MDWQKTLKKLSWYFLFALISWFGIWLDSPEVKELIKDNPLAVVVVNLSTLGLLAVKDYAKHGKEVAEKKFTNSDG